MNHWFFLWGHPCSNTFLRARIFIFSRSAWAPSWHAHSFRPSSHRMRKRVRCKCASKPFDFAWELRTDFTCAVCEQLSILCERAYLKPRSHRTRNQVCMQISNPLMLLASCVNTPIDHNVFQNLCIPVARCSASCVNWALHLSFQLQILCSSTIKNNSQWVLNNLKPFA